MAEPAEARYDLFIVHAEADQAWVDGYLRHALGIEPGRLITPRGFQLGASIPVEFERAVTVSRYTVVVLSPAFLGDRWAEFGEQLVSFTGVEEGRNRLVTLTLHPCDPPVRLRSRVGLDCTDWTKWDEQTGRLREFLGRPEPLLEVLPCPYPGMVPFRLEDARFFYGRETEVDDLLSNIRSHSFLLVVGPSGSGKSSLVSAGLLPRLGDPQVFPPGSWRSLVLRPGATPVARLTAQFGVDPSLPDAASALLDADPPARKLLLFVDQFEELFTQTEGHEERERFIGMLKVLRNDPRCIVMVSMRADFYPDLMNSPLWPVDRSQIFGIAPLRGEALRRAIARPAESVGVCLEDGLIERLIADAANEPGALPMLQEALVLLWGHRERRLLTRAAYDALGRDGRSGLAVAMATKADATLAVMDPDEQRVARRIFLRLVQFGEGRPDTRRQLGMDELRAADDAPGVFDRVFPRLIDNRLLTSTSEGEDGRRVDIAHEMLIVGWPASREWVRARREAEITRRRLEAKAKEWVRLGRGSGGLLDADELPEADRWLQSPDAAELGIDADVRNLVAASRAALDAVRRRARNRTRAAIATLTAVAVALGGLYIWGDFKRREAKVAEWKASEAAIAEAKAADQARKAQGAAEASAEEARRQLVRLNVGNGNRALAERDLPGALLWYVEALKHDSKDPQAEELHRVRIGAVLDQGPKLLHVWTVREGDTATLASPDGTQVATLHADGTARVWDIATGQALTPALKHNGPIMTYDFSPDGRVLATAGQDRTLRLWDPRSGKAVGPPLEHPQAIQRLIFASDGRVVIGQFAINGWKAWDTREGKLLADPGLIPLDGLADWWTHHWFSPAGPKVARQERAGIRFFHAATGKPLGPTISGSEVGNTIPGRNPANFVAWSPDGTKLALVILHAFNSYVVIIDVANQRIAVPRIELPGLHPSALTFSHDSTLVASASDLERGARVWNASTGAAVTDLLPTREAISCIEFTPDDRFLVASSGVSGTDRGEVYIYNVQHGDAFKLHLRQNAIVVAGHVTPDGLRLVTHCVLGRNSRAKTAYDDTFRPVLLQPGDQVRVWEIVANGLKVLPMPHRSVVQSRDVSPATGRAVTGGGVPSLWGLARAGAARLWDLETGQEVGPALRHGGPVNKVRFSNDGRYVVTASDDGEARVWEAATGRPAGPPIEHGLSAPDFLLTHDSRRAVLLGPNPNIIGNYYNTNFPMPAPPHPHDDFWVGRIWNLATGAPISPLIPGTGCFLGPIDPHDHFVMTSGTRKPAQFWDIASGHPVTLAWASGGNVHKIVFSADGRLVAVCYTDNTVRIWDVAAGQPMTPLIPHYDAVSDAVFDRDSLRLLTSQSDGGVRVWNARTGQPLTPVLTTADPTYPRSNDSYCKGQFSTDGQLLVINATPSVTGVNAPHSVSLRDAATGDPVTPLLGLPSSSGPVIYDPAMRRLCVMTNLGLFEWRLRPASGDLAELESTAHVISGLRLDGVGGTAPVLPEELARKFQELKARRDPRALAAGTEAAAAWHWAESGSIGSSPQFRAFHLGALVKLWPRQPLLRRRLGEALLALGRADDAAAVLRDELTLQQEHPTVEPLDRAEVLLWLGHAATALGKPDEARNHYRLALEAARRASGDRSLDAAQVHRTIGNLERSTGNFAAAEASYKAADDAAPPEILQDDHVDRVALRLAQAFCAFRQNDAPRAEAILLDQYHRVEKAKPQLDDPMNAALQRTLEDIVGFYKAWGKPEKAEPFARQLAAAGPRPGAGAGQVASAAPGPAPAAIPRTDAPRAAPPPGVAGAVEPPRP